MNDIPDYAALRAHMGQISAMAERKVLPWLDRHCRAFIGLSPFLVLATADADGRVDASPRGDPPGFVEIVDDRTLLLPDRLGNNRVDSFGNVLSAPGVGLIFFVPGIDETLRVNGQARLLTEPARAGAAASQRQAAAHRAADRHRRGVLPLRQGAQARRSSGTRRAALTAPCSLRSAALSPTRLPASPPRMRSGRSKSPIATGCTDQRPGEARPPFGGERSQALGKIVALERGAPPRIDPLHDAGWQRHRGGKRAELLLGARYR